MVIRNGGNVQAINKLSDIKHDLVATSTVANIFIILNTQCSFSVCINI